MCKHRLIYINNRLTPELAWFNVELVRRPAEPECEVSLQLSGDGRGVLVVGVEDHNVSDLPDNPENGDGRGVDSSSWESMEQYPRVSR